MKYDIIVIGGGPAGITLSKILGKKYKMAVIRPEDHSMIYCAMPYAIEKIIPIEKTLKSDNLVLDAGAELIRDTVVKVDFDSKKLNMKSGNVLEYDKLIIATGAEPILPPIDGINLKGIHKFKTRNDLDIIKDAVEKDKIKNAVVVGAGAIGIELAQALNHVKVNTYLVDIAESVLPNLVDTDFAPELKDELNNMGLNLKLSSKVVKLEGADKVQKVILDNGDIIDLQDSGIVVFSVGTRANVELFKDTKLEIGPQGIVVNDKMETNLKDVFAVGDCVQYISAITKEISLGKLATNAVPMARMLGKNLLGDNRSYKGFYNGAATKVGKYFVGGTGFNEKVLKDKGFDIVVGTAELTNIFPVMPGSKKARMKLIADKKTLKILGGQIITETPVTDKVDLITMAIQFELTVRDLVNFSYSAQPYQSFFPANNLIVACSENILMKLKK